MARVSSVLLAAASVAVLASNVVADDCPNVEYGRCGNAASPECCPDNDYCMPWSTENYECRPLPSQCSRQYTGYDFYGGDIKTVYGLQPGDCCAQCLSTDGCLAYTFVSGAPDSASACYLKAGMGSVRKTVGVISAVIDRYTPEMDTTPKRLRRLNGLNDLNDYIDKKAEESMARLKEAMDQ